MSADNQEPAVNRRTALKMGGAAGAAGLGLAGAGPLESPTKSVKAAPPALLAAGAVVGAGVAGYAAGREHADGVDPDEVEAALEWEDAVTFYQSAREWEVEQDQMLASLSRDIQYAENLAREEAIWRIYEAEVDGLSESDAEEAAEEAISEVFARVEREIIRAFTLRLERLNSYLLNAQPGLEWYFWEFFSEDRQADLCGDYYCIEEWHELEYYDVQLVDGQQISIPSVSYSDRADTHAAELVVDPFKSRTDYDPTIEHPNAWSFLADDHDEVQLSSDVDIVRPDPDEYDVDSDEVEVPEGPDAVMFPETEKWYWVHQDLVEAHDSLQDEVSTMLSTYWGEAENYSLAEMTGPLHLADVAGEADSWSELRLVLDALGYPISEYAARVEFEDPEDEDEVIQMEGYLAWTAADDTELPVGVQIHPEDYPGSIMMAAQYEVDDDGETEEETDFIELLDYFTIIAYEEDQVAFDERETAESDTDPDEIAEMYEEFAEIEENMEELVDETLDDSVGGWFPSFGGILDAPVGMLGVAAAIFIGFLLLRE